MAKQRLLNVQGRDYPLSRAGFIRLVDQKLVYDCGDGHDLHLDVERDFSLQDVETILLAISRKPI